MTATPAAPPLHQIADVLGSVARPGAFAARRTGAAADLHITVAGVGPVALPLTAAAARRLIAAATPARYGRREQTLLDPAVRDTWELPASAITIAPERWQPALAAQLAKVARELDLAPGLALAAELHNLLVYEPGQHFAVHQDSEKAPRMIGTLVVLLPSESRGGGLVIRHGGETRRYRGSPSAPTFVAFYADCHHEVRPVTAGYRAALTFNLIAVGEADAADVGDVIARLDAALAAHFATPRPARWGAASLGPPDRLVYLLDHQYTAAGLAWADLKAADARRAALLRAVATRRDCAIALGLADVHEVWSCEDEYWRSRSRRWDDVDLDDEAPADDQLRVDGHTLVDLCSSDLELHHAIDGDGRPVRGVAAAVEGDELCETRPSLELTPYRSEHEGYTGNAGNSVERWYHRAAIVVWPRSREFVLLARARPAAALAAIGALVRRGKQAEACARIDELRPFWDHTVRSVANSARTAAGTTTSNETRRIGERALAVAARLDDADRAAALVAPLEHGCLRLASAPAIGEIVARHGAAWLAAQVARWAARDRIEARTAVLAQAPPLLARVAATAGPVGGAWVGALARDEWSRLREHLARIQAGPTPRVIAAALEELAPTIAALLAAARLGDDAALAAALLADLAPDTGYPITAAVAVVRAGQAKPAGLRRDPGLAALAVACADELRRRLAAPARPSDDWSITAPIRCACALCPTLRGFAAARDQTTRAWPLAEAGRSHVAHTIASHELPIRATVRRVGSPYTLELAKTRALFTAEHALRERWRAELAWLEDAAAPRKRPTGVTARRRPTGSRA
ncbi:MAG: 2OG-Fe(II) oxygenase [Myxococcales bacterium]|nr:2OG-Fe(II) oxygenase [Myxococcales bacterium]